MPRYLQDALFSRTPYTYVDNYTNLYSHTAADRARIEI
jgi:hypothetical protein